MPRDSVKTKRVLVLVVGLERRVEVGGVNQRLLKGLFSKTGNAKRQVTRKKKRKLFTKGHLDIRKSQTVTHPSVVKSSVITP